MPDVVSNDELNALAAEYVLGTLDYEERKGAAALLDIDPTFREIVRIWERRFGELHLMVEAVEPDPQLWLRIKPKMPGVEQAPLAIPSHADEPAAAAAVAALAAEPAPEPVKTPMPAPESAPADASPAEPKAEEVAAVAADTPAPAVAAQMPPSEVTEAKAAETKFAERLAEKLAEKLADARPAETTVEENEPVENKPNETETKPAEASSPAVAEAELKLAELAALLPVAAEPLPENGLHTHAPDLVARGFVPPAPMSTRGTPAVVEVPIRTGGRGWIAATLAMALIAVALAGLISAWRFFPERLPAQLRANTLLNLTTKAQPAVPEAQPAAPEAQPAAPKAQPAAPKAAARPKLAPFDE